MLVLLCDHGHFSLCMRPQVALLDLAFAFDAHQGFVEEFLQAFGTEVHQSARLFIPH